MSIAGFPQQWGKYRLDALVGQGAMGVVYKAFDTDIDRAVAIKVLHSHLLSGTMGPELEQRFKHEVKAAARCQHPNIVTIFDCGFYQGSPFMVMEYVNGIDLQVFLKSKQFLSINQSVNLILKVLDALQAAHNMGIVHRDIKPANIMMFDNGQVKVTDFGVAHIDTSDLTQIGDMIGTPIYMPPEALNGDRVNHLSDLYSAALVLLELLIKRRLKIDQINYNTLLLELQKQGINTSLAAELAKVLDIALQIDPQKRYQDALSFYKALANCLDAGSNYYQLTDDLAATVFQVKAQLQDQAAWGNKISEASLLAHDLSQLSLVEKCLTSYLGPIAKVLVKKQAGNTSNMTQLLERLIEYIPSEVEKEKFIRGLESSGVSKNTSASGLTATQSNLSPEYIEKVTNELTYYLGPIARHLVRAALKKTTCKEQLQALLAEKISNLDERSTFLRNCVK